MDARLKEKTERDARRDRKLMMELNQAGIDQINKDYLDVVRLVLDEHQTDELTMGQAVLKLNLAAATRKKKVAALLEGG